MANGNALTQSAGATPPLLYSFGTTTITGTALAALFPTGTPMTYQFAVASSQYIFTNVKGSADGTINVPVVFTSGTTNYSTNSVGPLSTLKITDMSGSLSASWGGHYRKRLGCRWKCARSIRELPLPLLQFTIMVQRPLKVPTLRPGLPAAYPRHTRSLSDHHNI